MPSTYGDGSYITGSAEGTINGYSYVFDKIDHEKPVGQADAMNSDGTPKGGAFVRMKEKISVTIKAITGTPVPAQMVPFALAFHGEASKNWVVTTVKITSSNEGAQIRTYTADLCEHINAIT
jgi:hypothetical protein